MQHMIYMFAAAASPIAGIVTLTDATVIDEDVGTVKEAIAGIRLNADGTLEKNEKGVYTQLNSSTDWIDPNSASAAVKYVRATEVSYVITEDSFSVFGNRAGTMGPGWLTLGAGQAREWTLTANTSTAGNGQVVWVIDIEIARDSGGADILDIGRFTLRGNVPGSGPE